MLIARFSQFEPDRMKASICQLMTNDLLQAVRQSIEPTLCKKCIRWARRSLKGERHGNSNSRHASDVGGAAGAICGARAHADLARSAGLPAQFANEEYVEALARIVAPVSFRALTSPAPRWC
jgi:hypothetical protein